MAAGIAKSLLTKPAWDFALLFRAKYKPKTLIDTREILLFRDGRYVQENGLIAATIEAKFKDAASNALVAEITGHIERATLTRRDSFDNDVEWLNLENCMVNLLTKETKPHSPDLLTTVRLPVKYDATAKCSEFLKFLDEVVPDDKETVMDFMAYCLWRRLPFKKALLLVGEKDNGKSTYIGFHLAFFGAMNVSSVSLQKLDQDRFAAADLYGKLLNTCADLPTKPLDDTSVFRQLTGNDRIRAERKFKDAFEFVYRGKLVFSANRLPYVYDDLAAFFERWIIVFFPNTFDGKKADPKKLEKITTEEELSGVLNILLQRLPSVIEKGVFTKEKNVDEIREKYYSFTESNIDRFIEDAVEEDEMYKVRKDVLYRSFRAFCKAQGKIPESENAFGRKLKRRRYSVFPLTNQQYRSGQVMENGKRFRVWHGIRLFEGWVTENQTLIDNENSLAGYRRSINDIP